MSETLASVNTTEYMTEVAHRYAAALQAGDLEAVMAMFDPEATVEDPVGTEPKRGEAAIRAFFTRVTSLSMKAELEGEPRAVANELAFALRLSFVRDGKPTTVAAIDHFRFNDAGKIVAMRAFFGPQNIHVG